MANYHLEIQNVVNTALAELEAEHKAGKLTNAPVANNHFLVHWVTKALKAQRFHRCVGDDLTQWQKAGRSKGTESQLLPTFQRISAYYAHFLQSKSTHRSRINKSKRFWMRWSKQVGKFPPLSR